MSFTNQNFPVAYRYLRPEVKLKAIEIANSLFRNGFEQQVVEVIALSNAKLWACYSLNEQNKGGRGLHVHLIPHPEGWALISQDASRVYFIRGSKNDALIKARAFAKNEKLRLYIHSPAGNIHDSESFVVNRPVSSPEAQGVAAVSLSFRVEEGEKANTETRREPVRRPGWVGRLSPAVPAP